MTPRSEATRRRLVDAARELIATEGLDISLSDVAERAGVTRMTLYRHFGPRRELLLEVLLNEAAPVAQQAGAVLADRSLPLADRAHRAMCSATLTLSATPVLNGVLADGLERIDPSGAMQGLLTAAVRPFLDEASTAGVLRGTPDEATEWILRQLVAAVVGRRDAIDPAAVSREVAWYFLPSLLRVDDVDCERLAASTAVTVGVSAAHA